MRNWMKEMEVEIGLVGVLQVEEMMAFVVEATEVRGEVQAEASDPALPLVPVALAVEQNLLDLDSDPRKKVLELKC